jgi:hypothetical protein
LIAILLPALSATREQARITQCASNLRQQGISTMMYSADYRDTLPKSIHQPGDDYTNPNTGRNGLDQPFRSAQFLADPFGGSDPATIAPKDTYQCNLGIVWFEGYFNNDPGEALFCPSQTFPRISRDSYFGSNADGAGNGNFPSFNLSYGANIYISYDHNVMARSADRARFGNGTRQRLWRNTGQKTDPSEIMLGMCSYSYPTGPMSATQAHGNIWTTMWGDTSTHIVKSQEVSDIRAKFDTNPGDWYRGDNEVADFDRGLSLLMGDDGVPDWYID